jgi:hypothetical protein
MSTIVTGIPTVPPRCASVADQLAFDALPDDTKALIERLYGKIPAVAGQWFTREHVEDAYEAGFESGQDSVEIERSSLSRRDMEAWINHLTGGTQG